MRWTYYPTLYLPGIPVLLTDGSGAVLSLCSLVSEVETCSGVSVPAGRGFLSSTDHWPALYEPKATRQNANARSNTLGVENRVLGSTTLFTVDDSSDGIG